MSLHFIIGNKFSEEQGAVRVPILFLMYINENVQSSIRLFTDDSIIYRKIYSNIDHQILQTDLIQPREMVRQMANAV